VPESWEVASDEEWEELQRGILKMFGAGPALMQRIIGKVLKVEPPVDRIRRVEQKLQPKVKKPPVVEETPYQKRRRLGQVPQVPTTGTFPWTAEGGAALPRIGQALAEGYPTMTPEEVSKAASELTFPTGAKVAMMTPGLLGLPGSAIARMFGGQIVGGMIGKEVERAGFNPRIDIGPVSLGPSGLGQIGGAVLYPILGPFLERAAIRGGAALPGLAERATPFTRRLLAGEAGGAPLGPKVPKEPFRPEKLSAAEIDRRLAKMEQEIRAAEEAAEPALRAAQLEEDARELENILGSLMGKRRLRTPKPIPPEAPAVKPRVPEKPIIPKPAAPPTEPPAAPPKPPTPLPADSGVALNDYFAGAPAGEKAQRTLIRRYEGEVGLERDLYGQELIQARRLATKAPEYFSAAETPQSADIIQVIDYPGPIEEAIAKVGLPPEAANTARALRQILDQETAKMQATIPNFEGRQWYYPHEYQPAAEKVAVGRGAGRGRFGVKPGFMRQRKLEGTILDVLAERPDLTLKTWDAIETVERRVYRGIIYRQQTVMLQNLKRTGLALPASEVVEEGWRVPKIGPAFESRPVPGKPDVYTQPWAVPRDIAKALEDHFGTSAFNANVPLRVMREAIATAKFVKVFGGLFQNIDYSTRTLGYATKYRDIATLGEIPKALARAYFPGLDTKIRALELQDPIIQGLYRHGLNREAGLGFVGPEYERIAGELTIYKIPIIGRAAKAFGSGTFRNAHNSFVTGIGRRVAQNYMKGGMSLEEAAAKAALDINESFSSLPNWQSVFRNPTTRDFMRTFLFSMAEQESWIRMPFRQKTLLLSILFDVVAAGNILNYVWQGEFLPASAYKPFENVPGVDYDPMKEGPKMLGYNTGFLRPELPYTGPLGRKEYLDLLGQADTPIRILADPKFAAITRLGQLPSAVMQAYSKEETFGEKKIEGVGGWAQFIAKQVAPIPATSAFGESQRIGTVGALLQVTGFNVSAERLGHLTARRYKELTGKDWDVADVKERREAVNQYPELLEIQVEREKAGKELGGDLQGALLSQRDEAEGKMAQMIQAGQATGVEFRNAYKDFQQERRTLNEQAYAEGKLPEPKRTPEETIARQYWAVELQTGAEGLPDWETFFAERDAILQTNADTVPVETMKTWLRDYEVNLWRDDTVRAKVEEMLDAEAVMETYYSIPAKRGMGANTGNKAAALVKKAQATAASTGWSFYRALARVAQNQKEYDMAVRYQSLPDLGAREYYKKQHPDAFAWYSDIPLGIQAGQLAGVEG
jgi:hypothetical protein